MAMRRWVRGLLAVVLALGGGAAITVVASPAAAAAPRAAGEAGRVEVGLALVPGRRQVAVTLLAAGGQPAGLLRLIAYRGTRELSRVDRPLAALRPGRAVRVVLALPATGEGDFGLTAVALPGSSSKFLAVRPHAGSLIPAPAYGLLDDAVAAADRDAGRITGTAYAAETGRRHQVAGSVGTIRQSLAETTTVTGSASYRDADDKVHPVRGGLVELVDTAGLTWASAYTRDAGTFTISTATAAGGSYRVRLSTKGTFGWVSAGGGDATYNAFSAVQTLPAGGTWDGVTIALTRDPLAGRAFALFDALRSVGGFYQSIRGSSWQTALRVDYPSGDEGSHAGGGTIHTSGGLTMCDGALCSEDGFDWDVLAHESGHIVADQAGLNGPADSGHHSSCVQAWGSDGGTGTGIRDKQAGIQLAWSEGWATFYGLKALAAGVPNIRNAGGVTYDDDSGPPANTSDQSYSLEENSDSCGVRGDDNERAVMRALWDFSDSGEDALGGGETDTVSWTFADILGKLDAANAVTFSAAWTALSAGRGFSELETAKRILEVHGMAPTGLRPTGYIPAARQAFQWTAGGIPGHLNNSFQLRVRNGFTGAVLLNKTNLATTSYTPTTAEWAAIVAAKSVNVDVFGSQTTAPATGPYPSAQVSILFDQPASQSRKIMVVGDSISQGLEGDWTWRYRLYQHLVAAGAGADFVGPYTGTTKTPSTPPVFNGAYRNHIGFDSAHFAQWGRQAHQAMNDVRAQVSTYQPDYLLVELGFNDLGWGVSNPDGLIADIKTLIAQARAGRAGVKVLVANVPHRSPLTQLPQLDAVISEYNGKLGAALASVSTAASPVALVDISTGYAYATDAYDGLHPNSNGEYKIARAFANVLAGTFGVGTTFTATSPGPDLLVPAAPTSITATPTGTGVLVSWSHSFGAGGYWFEQRLKDSGQAWQRLPLPIPADQWDTGWLSRGSTYEFRVLPVRGDTTGPASAAASAVADPLTADGPPNITTTSGPGSLTVSWSPATGLYSDTVNGYVVYYLDRNDPNAFIASVNTSGLTATITGLTSNHNYAIAVASVNAAGAGSPVGGPDINVPQ
ncbi:GDSL-type esterase/lipase family protein [Actinoplanes oblitus]|uniref:GDSL-type esterase/lipase family protein n=1 Tax=Actinoplanes oblitus TaxID=3040509 RepID=A0ABY8WSQ7_9ACTN|nr:fibronectin type III domain-containing protein [Actinoplanes oblitus]WIN00493.1 GDSL-type esterase/lipase family protein [Actinoplanes oblitus]